MAYKSIFTVVTDHSNAAAALAQAGEITAAQDAHLEVMCLGVDRSQTSYYEVGVNAAILQAAIEQAHKKAESIEEAVKADLRKTDLRWNSVVAVAAAPDAGQPAIRAARFADLAVVPTPYGKNRGAEDVIVLEALLFNASCPTLIVPDGNKPSMPDNVVIGWNESAEALRAVRASMPFLKAAKAVHVAVIDPPGHGPERSDPGGALAVMLARHGVNCDIQVMSRGSMSIAETLSKHATETASQLLVMGGYGHSRFREAVLGGATRDMLENAKVPVLMAH